MLVVLAALVGLLTAPDGKSERWVAPDVSSPMFESHPAFDPWTGDLYFVRSDKSFRGWRILVSRCRRSGWAAPMDAPFAGDGVEADPWFAPGGRTLYFISTRSTDGVARKDLDIWKVERDRRGGWGRPERLPAPVNSGAQEWFPRLGRDGWLYFGSGRPGGVGKTDIWRARQSRGAWRVENLGTAVNTPEDEYEPLPMRNGDLIVQAGSEYVLVRRTRAGWGPRRRLGPALNANGSEIGALLSPSGRSMMFARDLGEPTSGEFFVARSARESWPAPCPRAASRPARVRYPAAPEGSSP